MINKHHINVLIACEESQAEQQAFARLGFNAYSCDLQPCRYDPSHHIQGDVVPLLNGVSVFRTQDGKRHRLSRWHLIIAHPPCTYLCKCGSVWLWKNGSLDAERVQLMQQGRDFFFQCYHAQCDYLAVENPIPMRRAGLPRPSCFADPSWFGVKYTKKTLYWLRNLPPLMAQLINPDTKCFVRSSRGKYRSRTFPQLADALAQQWGDYVCRDIMRRRTECKTTSKA